MMHDMQVQEKDLIFENRFEKGIRGLKKGYENWKIKKGCDHTHESYLRIHLLGIRSPVLRTYDRIENRHFDLKRCFGVIKSLTKKCLI